MYYLILLVFFLSFVAFIYFLFQVHFCSIFPHLFTFLAFFFSFVLQMSLLCLSFLSYYRVFSLTWPASMKIYWNKRKCLHKKRVQLPEDWFGTPTWPPFYCFGTPIWPPWRHVKTLYFQFYPYWPLVIPPRRPSRPSKLSGKPKSLLTLLLCYFGLQLVN